MRIIRADASGFWSDHNNAKEQILISLDIKREPINN